MAPPLVIAASRRRGAGAAGGGRDRGADGAERRPRLVATPRTASRARRRSLAREAAKRVGAAHQPQSSSSPISPAGDRRRRSAAPGCRAGSRGCDAIEPPWRTARISGGALDQLVARQREQNRPWACAPSQCPERPTRCSSVAMVRGDPSWQTRSTWPTSMPSSSEAVATTTRDARRSSAPPRPRSRILRDRLPWCAATLPSPRRSLELVRDALDQAARVDEDQRRAVRCACDRRCGRRCRRTARACDRPELLLGDLDAEVELAAVADVDDGAIGRRRRGSARSLPTSNRAIPSIGFCVALRPMRCRRRPARASSRSSDSARWAPRLSPATAWISSTITVSRGGQHLAGCRPR